VNVALGVPVVGALLVLVLLRKIVPGWALDDQKAAYEERIADMKAGYERQLDAANRQNDQARADLAETARELRETTPVLVRANDALTATQDVLSEILRRGALHG
jgi:capsid protein